MAHWPLRSWPVTDGTSVASSVVLTANATTAHTPGAYVTLIAALPANVVELTVIVGSVAAAGTNTAALLDLALGAASSEVVFWSNFNVGNAVNTGIGTRCTVVPLSLPSGARLSARVRGAVLSQQVTVNVSCRTGSSLDGSAPVQQIVTMGADEATSRGVVYASGTTIGVYGAWTEVVASTPQSFRSVIASFDGAADTTLNNAVNTTQVGVGGVGAEAPVASYVLLTTASEGVQYTSVIMPNDQPIAAGSRLSVRAHRSVSGNESLGVILYGLR